jgi:hypothetical protein
MRHLFSNTKKSKPIGRILLIVVSISSYFNCSRRKDLVLSKTMLNEELTSHFIERTLKRRSFKSDNINIKRLKTSFENEKFLRTNLQNLPNELFYQIFSYLTDGEIVSSFSSLTQDNRFDQLIRRRTSLNFRSIGRRELFNYEHLINPSMIRDIRLFNDDDTPGIIKSFFYMHSFDLGSHFPNLKNLVLDQPEQQDLIVNIVLLSKEKVNVCLF